MKNRYIHTIVWSFMFCSLFGSNELRKNIFYDVPVAYAVGEIVTRMFPDAVSSDIMVTPLSGGYPGATLLLLAVGEHKYVVKIHHDTEKESDIATELYALQHMGKLGIAPELYFVSEDKKSFVMDYKEAGTVSVEYLQQVETIEYMARMLRQVHSMPRNPFAQEDYAKEIRFRVIDLVKRYQTTYAAAGMSGLVENAIQALEQLFEDPRLHDAEKVMIHGDVHPRNICGVEKDIVLIDWCFSSWNDPFFDIAALSVTGGYTDEQECLFFNTYLGREITELELSRYGIIKKMSFLYAGLWWSFCLLQAVDQGESVTPVKQIHSYAHYSALFNKNNFSAQMAYEAVLAAFKAGGIIIEEQGKHLF